MGKTQGMSQIIDGFTIYRKSAASGEKFCAAIEVEQVLPDGRRLCKTRMLGELGEFLTPEEAGEAAATVGVASVDFDGNIELLPR